MASRLGITVWIVAVAMDANSTQYDEIRSAIEVLATADDPGRRDTSASLLVDAGKTSIYAVVLAVGSQKLDSDSALSILTQLPFETAALELPPRLQCPRNAVAGELIRTAIEFYGADRIVDYLVYELDSADETTAWRLAYSLSSISTARHTDETILTAARRLGGRSGHQLISHIYRRVADLLGDDERLEYLLEERWGAIDIGPEVFDVDPECRRESLRCPNEEDDAFLERNRNWVLPILRTRLREMGSPLAALLLARMGDLESLPSLRRMLLTTSDSYGWETNCPLLFYEGNHRGYHAASRAIEHLTGVPLEEAVRLTAVERDTLIDRGDGTALMILHRLAPESSRREVFRQFRTSIDSWHCVEAGNSIVVYGLVKSGMPGSVFRKALGRPDRHEGSRWIYSCGQQPHSAFVATVRRGVVLKFERGQVADITWMWEKSQ